ncbi:L-sorbosone dehydrogenase [Neorhodopirellula lusitana]|uniref:L-sorbosone dehydrogenase n=1 Tax=Neorhodopirellula lusitana TaxID=445327 RepID=UPI00384A6BDF
MKLFVRCRLLVADGAEPLIRRKARSVVFAMTGFVVALVGFAGQQAANGAGLGVTSPDKVRVPEGFEVDLVHAVTAEGDGSWVSLTTDPKGRLIACDQYGGLFRIDVSEDSGKVEKLDADLKGAQGLLCAFGSLYANVNSNEFPAGVWRLTDTNGDDQYDKKEHLIPLNSGGEHGPHGLILTPDGKRILSVQGNNTKMPDVFDSSRVPKNWSEDHLLGRMPDARGHNANRLAPGGFIMSFNPDGGERELIATGFRNPYDIALNEAGELMTYDADMEWDVGTPWYRPTRVNHVISGGEFAWRNGTGKWPAYYPDSFGAAVDIGAGSPTGICFGYGANFPSKFQKALFIADWSYGNIHAVHLTEDGSSYGGSYEIFATAAPLPVTDMVVHSDGNLYFTIGGRRTQSGLYRVRYVGSEASTSESSVVTNQRSDEQCEAMRATRHQLEALHVDDAALSLPAGEAVELALQHLDDDDRAIRFVARVALEHRDVELWKDQVLALDSPRARTLGLIALARCGQPDSQSAAMDSLLKIDFAKLDDQGQIAVLRAAGLIAMRLGDFTDSQSQQLLEKLDGVFPTKFDNVNRELAMMLVRLNAPGSTAALIEKQFDSPSQESQIHYAMTLRNATEGWNDDLRRKYLGWFHQMATARGGMSFGGFLDNIKAEWVKGLTEDQRTSLADAINPPVSTEEQAPTKSRPFVKQYTVDDLVGQVESSTHQPDFASGKSLFADSQCYKCHRMGLQGGILGPDLTSAGGKFNIKDMLISIVDPSKVISDQYGATQFLTVDGEVLTGRIINVFGDQVSVMTNMLDPSKLTRLKLDDVEESNESRVSMMPTGLLDTLTVDEIIDLVAYLRAGGNAEHSVYAKPSDGR